MADLPLSDPALVRNLADAIREAAGDGPPITIMHVCGTHEHELRRYALRQLLPPSVSLVAGPGCPVCITPASAVITAIRLALSPAQPIVCTYGDMVRVPSPRGSLLDSRGYGANVRVVLGLRDAIALARETPEREVVFFSVGFETTAAPVAATLRGGLPANLTIYCCHRYVPPAVEALAAADDGRLQGFLLPGHATVITGAAPYAFLPEKYNRAAAIAGFEPVDILSGMLSLVRQVRQGKNIVANCYPRTVRLGGNPAAQAAIDAVFTHTDAAWRGIGMLPATGLLLRPEYRLIDALERHGIVEEPAEDVMPGCICHLVLIAKRTPDQCPLFGTSCTPESPHGPCMVGGEGTCRAAFLYPEATHD